LALPFHASLQDSDHSANTKLQRTLRPDSSGHGNLT
jgi:hypothetical protein